MIDNCIPSKARFKFVFFANIYDSKAKNRVILLLELNFSENKILVWFDSKAPLVLFQGRREF